MQNQQHLNANQSTEAQIPSHWYGELCDIIASEQMFHLPDCEWLLDRLTTNLDRRP